MELVLWSEGNAGVLSGGTGPSPYGDERAKLSYVVAPDVATELPYCPLAPQDLPYGSILIDWGDGTTDRLEHGSCSDVPAHGYEPGEYTVTLSARPDVWLGLKALYFGSTNVDDMELFGTGDDSRVRYLKKIETPLPTTLLGSFAGLFFKCAALESVPENLLDNNPQAANFNCCFYGCSALEAVPAKLFSHTPDATEFMGCFAYCTALRAIPRSLFSYVPHASDVSYCFYGCESVGAFEVDLLLCTEISNADKFALGTASGDNYAVVSTNSTTAATLNSAITPNVILKVVVANMALPNIQRKLFQNDGFGPLLRPDIIPWEPVSVECSVVASRQTFKADSPAGSVVGIEGLKYLPGQLMVFVNGVKLSPGIGYAEGAPDADGYCSEITLLIGVLEGDAAKFVAHNGVAVEVEAVVEFRYTVAPESTSSLSYCPLDPSRLADGTSIDIDWGDGSTEVLEAGSGTDCPSHAYSTSDGTRYQITLSAGSKTWVGVTAMFFGTSTTVSLNVEPNNDDDDGGIEPYATDQTGARVRYLVSVDTALPSMGFTTGAYMFYNNRLLESVPSDLFSAMASECTSFYYAFYRCESLTSLPSGLFAGCSATKTFYGCFSYCSGFKNLPEGLFDDCVSVTSFDSCFRYCEGLVAAPANLFVNCSKVTTFYQLFSNCTGLESVSSDLLARCSTATNFNNLFYNCSALESIPGGLFDDCTAATSFQASFEYCSTITEIPEGLFDNCEKVTTFNYCFSYCGALSDVPPALFANCSATTNLGYCFNNSTQIHQLALDLTNVQNVTTVTSFAYPGSSDPYIASKMVYVACGSKTHSAFGDGERSSLGCTVECVEV